MANKVLGASTTNGFLGVSPDWANISCPNGRTLQSILTNGTVQYWKVEATQQTGGELLTDGNYANPVSVAGNSLDNANAIKAILVSQGLSGEYGYFTDGFTLNDPLDVGIDASYQFWKYVGAETLPYAVPQSTDPSAGGWELVKFNLEKLENVAAMRAYDYSGLAQDTTIEWAGYYQRGDGGGNKGLLKRGDSTSLTDDGGSIFIISNDAVDGVWVEADLKGTIDVSQFGALPDYMPDKTETDSRIQNALNIGGRILIRKTINPYEIHGSTYKRGLTPIANTEIVGIGKPEIKLMSSVTNCISNVVDDFWIRPVVYTGRDNITIKGIKFNGNASNLPDPTSLGDIVMPDITVPNTQGDNFSYGVYMLLCKDISIIKCEFVDFWYGGHNLFGVDGQTVKGNKYRSIGKNNALFPNYAAMGSDGTPGSDGAGGYTTERFPSRRVRYSNNTIEDCGAVLRANGGINNGPVGISDDWEIKGTVANNIRASNIILSNAIYRNIRIHHNTAKNIAGFKGISVTGEGLVFGQPSNGGDIEVYSNTLSDIGTSTTSTGSYITVNAGFGRVLIKDNTLYGRHGNQPLMDGIVVAGEAQDAVGTVTYADKYQIEGNDYDANQLRFYEFLSGTPNTHITGNTYLFTGANNTYTRAAGSSTVQPFLYRNNYVSSSATIINGTYNKGFIQDNIGYKTKNMGVANVQDGDTVAHGLPQGAPPIVIVELRADSNVMIRGVSDPTNITFHMFNADGTPYTGAALPICWKVIAFVEFEKA